MLSRQNIAHNLGLSGEVKNVIEQGGQSFHTSGSIDISPVEGGFKIGLSKLTSNFPGNFGKLMTVFGVATALAALPKEAQADLIHQGYSSFPQVDGNPGFLAIADGGLDDGVPIITLTNSTNTDFEITDISFINFRVGGGTSDTDSWNILAHTDLGAVLGKTTWDSNATLSHFGAATSYSNYGGNRIESWLSNINQQSDIIIPANGSLYLGITNGNFITEGITRISTTDLTLAQDDYGYFSNDVPYSRTMMEWSGNSFKNLAVNVYANPVPEPASLATVGLGIAALAGLRRKKKED